MLATSKGICRVSDTPEMPQVPVTPDTAETSESPAYTPYVRRSLRPQAKPVWQHPAALAGIAIAAVLVLFVLVDAVSSAGRIHPGVRVQGIAVGGMTTANAAAKLATELPKKAQEPVTVTYEDRSWKIAPADISLGFDYKGIAAAAYGVGREKAVFSAAGSRISAWFGGRDIRTAATADAAKLDAVLNKIAEKIDVKPVDARVKIEDGKPVVVAAKPGVGLQRDKASRAIAAAFLSANRQVAAPIGTIDVAIDDAEAKKAADKVDTMLSAPVVVSFAEKSWTFSPDEIATWIQFKTAEASGSAAASLEPFVSAEKATTTIVPRVGGDVGHPAKDAQFKTRSGSVIIVPSEEGVGPDVETLATEMTQVLLQKDANRSVVLRTRVTQPKLTTDEARSYGIDQRISTFTTTYDASNTSRVNNIHLLGDSLDGRLIAPGSTFSFNGTVGERTADKGYQEANAIVDGKLVPQLGGGICQVGTTLFNAIFESGFPVVERHNHSVYISHYPKGRDATVSWGGPDLKFKNDSDKWVLISVSYTSSSITIALYGTNPGYTVTAQTGPWTNVKPFPVKEVPDATLYVGKKVIEERGTDGKWTSVVRTVSKDGAVVRTDTFVSKYKATTQVVRVGTKVKGSTTPTGTAR